MRPEMNPLDSLMLQAEIATDEEKMEATHRCPTFTHTPPPFAPVRVSWDAPGYLHPQSEVVRTRERLWNLTHLLGNTSGLGPGEYAFTIEPLTEED
jgi:hypothetical protein